jgi:preprotein translocase subunit Sec61beta
MVEIYTNAAGTVTETDPAVILYIVFVIIVIVIITLLCLWLRRQKRR